MKKTAATALALIAAGMLLCSCGGKEISGAPVTSAPETTTTPAETAPESSEEDSSEEIIETNGEYAKEFTRKIESGVYALEGTVQTAMFGESPMSVKVSGEDLYVKMTTMGIDVEVCQIDGVAYNLMPQMKTYTVSKATTVEQQGVNTYALSESAKFIGNEMEDGLIVEKYEIPIIVNKTDVSIDLGIDGGSYECRYYFDTNKELKKVSGNLPATGETVFTVTGLSFEDIKIELPDLTDWTELKQGEKLDKVATIKMGLAAYGVTEEMVTAAGYTYEQLAEMDEAEVTEILTKIAEDNGLTFDPNA
ncbi:MAG: hypothetical protein IKP95_06610 [Ruminococcus sp.]|nr:hypothetical protein [Ruminococcus sp.]